MFKCTFDLFCLIHRGEIKFSWTKVNNSCLSISFTNVNSAKLNETLFIFRLSHKCKSEHKRRTIKCKMRPFIINLMLITYGAACRAQTRHVSPFTDISLPFTYLLFNDITIAYIYINCRPFFFVQPFQYVCV